MYMNSLAQPSWARPPPRNWVHKKIPGCAVELNTQNYAWFGSQISLITAMSFREAMPPRTTHQGLCPWTPLGDFRFPDPLCPHLQILATPLHEFTITFVSFVMLTLLLAVEASSATRERGLRALRRLETYRATMKQERLNHLTVLHVHQDGLQKVKGDFVSANEYRRRVFSHIGQNA